MKDHAKSLKDKSEQEARRKMLTQQHMSLLTELVNNIRNKQNLGDEVPYFDPLDGGIAARCLFVMEAPGSKAVQSGFVSRNNDDETAKNLFVASVKAGIPRESTVVWNIVPWYLGTDEGVEAPKNSDIDLGLDYLLDLTELLPELQIIVLAGRSAQKAEAKLRLTFRDIDIVHTRHPSSQSLNSKENRDVFVRQLRQVRRNLDFRR